MQSKIPATVRVLMERINKMVLGRRTVLYAAVSMSVLLLLVACVAVKKGRVVSPHATLTETNWSEEERARKVALRTLRVTREASVHLVRVSAAEEPHVHDGHDGTVFVLGGKFLVHFGDRSMIVGPGDVIEIPRGTPHWAENIHSEASEAYVIFTPPYDETDWRPVGQP